MLRESWEAASPLPWYLTFILYTGRGPYPPCPLFIERPWGVFAAFSFLFDTIFYTALAIAGIEFYVFPEILEFHYLDVWDASYGYDCVRMNQSIVDGRIHYLSTNKIQHISADHQDNRFRQSHNCTPVEFGFRR